MIRRCGLWPVTTVLQLPDMGWHGPTFDLDDADKLARFILSDLAL